MEKITYLIGAGASYHSLPLIKTMNNRMKAFRTFLEIQLNEGNLKHQFSEQFISELADLINIETKRTSIDAYAKELSINGDPDAQIRLLRLKAILSSYIIFEQLAKPEEMSFYSDNFDTSIVPFSRIELEDEFQMMIKTNIDKRYITFWGEYLTDKSNKLPENLRIISWNYDMQFESSYSQVKNFNLERTQQILQVYPAPHMKVEISKSCILKLNGTAGLIDDYTKKSFYNLFDLKKHSLMDNLDYLIGLLESNYHRSLSKPLFYFAWEDEPIVSETRKLAGQVMQDTTILVVIGYSFPTFNKSIDRQLFNYIPKLKKIYYQAPKNEMEDLLDRLDGINPNLKPMTKFITNLGTFHIPNEI